MSQPTRAEIEAEANKAQGDTSNLSGMTYQEGVAAALNWVLGEWADKPMEDRLDEDEDEDEED